MKRFVFEKVLDVGLFSIIATFLLLSILNIESLAYDRTVYDLEVNNPILNDGNNNGWSSWVNNDEDFYYTENPNSDAKASWTFPKCSKSGDYRVLIKLPQNHKHSSGSGSYQISKNTQSLKDCTVNQGSFYGYVSLGDSANTHHLFELKEGDIIKIEFTTDDANVTVGKAMLSYIEDFSLPIDRYSQTDDRWRCKKLSGAFSESDANCTGDLIPNPCGYYLSYNNTGPMGCWGCLTCAFTSALSYYGVCEVNINGEKKPINPRRIAATIDEKINEKRGYNSVDEIIWPPAISAMESLREGIDFGLLGKDTLPLEFDLNKGHWYEIEQSVKIGYPVVIKTKTLISGSNHWVLIKGIHILSENDVTFYICDSLDEKNGNLKDYNNKIYRYNVVTGPTLPKLARIEGQDPVYWLQNGKAYHVLSVQIIDAMSDLAGWDRNKIDVCPADVLEIRPPGTLPLEDTFEQGPDFIIASPDSDGLLIKLPDDPKVYVIENGKLRWITSPDVFDELGYDWEDIITVTPSILALIQDFYLLSGTLTDANGNPLRGYIYANETSGANLGNHVYTSDGTHEMALFPGTYRVYAQAYNSYPGGFYYLRTPDETLTINANTTLNITVPSYELYHLTGKVSDADGEGLSNITVRAHSPDNIYQGYVTTNSDGTYDALVTPGTYYLYFVPPNDSEFLPKYLYNVPIYDDFYQEVFLDSEEQYTLSGSLTDNNGNPIQGWIYANEIGGSNNNNVWSSGGTYEMALFLGTYRIYAQTYNTYPGGYTYIKTPYQNLTVNADATFNILAPSYDLLSLSGKVTNTNNIAQANVRINAYDNNGICQGNVRTDANGDYNLNLIPGTYRLRITAPPATYPPFEIQNLQISGDSVRNIRLSLEYTILDEAIAQLLANLELSLDVFDIINQEETLNYDVIIQGIKDLLQIILNWQGSEMKITLYDPNGAVYGEYQSTDPPINIEIPNPTEGTWTCEVTAVDVPHDNYPLALVVGISPNQAPEADANGPYSGTVDTPITFDASNSYDPDGEIATYEWDWSGDGVYDESSNSATITHTWSEVYSGTIYLRVKDSEGATDTDDTSVEVTAAQEIPGDLDGDGDVDYDDYLLFRPCYGSREGDVNFLSAADLDKDGCVTINDYRILRTLM